MDKQAENLNRYFSKEDTNSQQVYEKIVSITNYQGNANQYHNEISPDICQDAYSQKTKDNMTDAEKREYYLKGMRGAAEKKKRAEEQSNTRKETATNEEQR